MTRWNLWSFLKLALSALLIWLGAVFLLPLALPFLLGGALALGAEPLVKALRRAHVPRFLASGISVTMAFLFLILLVVLVCAFLIRELGLLAPVLPDLASAARSGANALESWLMKVASLVPAGMELVLQKGIQTLFSDGSALLDQAVQFALGLAGSILSHLPDSALTLGTAVISGYMISAKLPGISQWVRVRIPRQKLRALLATGKRVQKALGKFLLAQLQLGGVTLLILTMGFLLLRIPYAPVWAALVTLVDAFPVLGTGTILLPWSLISLLQGNSPQAVGLLGCYVTVSVLRSVLEPRLLGKQLGLDPLVTLMALYAGFKLWGLPGMIFAPVLAVTVTQLLPEGESRQQDGV